MGEETGAERRCLVTGSVKPKSALIRFVVGPESTIVPDVRERLPGRGLWVSARRADIEAAAKRGLFAKAAHKAVKVPDDLAAVVESLIVRHALELLGLARKAGLVAAGARQVETALSDRRAALLIEAEDASPREAARLRARAEAQEIALVRCFSAAELGLALGRQNVVHAALYAGPLARRFLDETVRLDGFRGADMRAGASARPHSGERQVRSE
jgi:predicted RNA-binding protein YlxR (DUF448 family)